MPYVFGIDISAFAVPNDWKAVSNQGVKFVFVKASENGFADAKFSVNWQGAKAVGMLRGAYHFFHPEAGNAAGQAAKFIQTVGADKGELPPILDLETVYVNGNPISLPIGAALAALVLDWLTRVENAFGRKPMIYTSAEFVRSHSLIAPWLVNYPLWLAQYPYPPGTTYFQGALADLNKMAGSTTPAAPPVNPPSPMPAAVTYTVQAGDTLASIAKKFNIDLTQLTNLNNAVLIRPGELLTISAPSAPAPSPAPVPATPAGGGAPAPTPQTYTVRAGDTLSAIAARFGTTVAAIAAANHIANPNLIAVGQVLKIPK